MKFRGRMKNTISEFEFLEQSLDEKEAEAYYVKWMRKYREYFKTDCEVKTIIMANRSIRARREIITSAILFEEAKATHASGCVSATYFLTYYSLFHAMWSVLFLNSDVDNNIHTVTHEKLKNLFCDYYTRNNFFDINMKEYILNLRDMREFFSYNVPFNMIGDPIDFQMLELILLKCFQLTNLHNGMLVECTGFINTTGNNIWQIETYFEMFNERRKNDGKKVEDPAEHNQLKEMFKYGVRITNYEVEFGHDWDEMGYTYCLGDKFDEEAVEKIQGKALSLVYKAIAYV